MSDMFTQQTYQTLQYAKSALGLAHKEIAGRVRRFFNLLPESIEIKPLSSEVTDLMRQRLEDLLEKDWQDAQQGIYPTALVFDNPWLEYFATYPRIWLDLPQSWQRSKDNNFQDLPAEVDLSAYPPYYRRNFHFQTGGYFSDESADLYDLQVEIIFNGAADAMRRRILAPLKAGLKALTQQPPSGTEPPVKPPFHPASPRILDLACGTGRTLKMIRAALPQASLHGVDLSEAYLRKANRDLSELPGLLPQLIWANAEALPYSDRYFQGVTCVFLFHEMPASVRQRVIQEAFRVLQPGGTFVVCDSIQEDDTPELKPVMQNFSSFFHEPFYQDYIRSDLSGSLTRAGFENIEVTQYFASKYWVAYKSSE